ncbi:SDR family NAD(P)-dependent oxidoreductase, partial [Streptomyces sp. NPDC048484]|uniref:type I polyketide synthase n=1 Tax=Streptomyces sp. NPDC048484 TaxID=3155146 RepID=UPI003412312C
AAGGQARALVQAVARLYVDGVDVDWSALFAGRGARRVELPTYAFQREHYWLVDTPTAGAPAAMGLSAAGHPLLSAVVSSPESDGVALTGRIGLDTHPWLADHRVLGRVLLPGTAFVELAVRAGDEVGCGRVAELTLQAPLVLPEHGSVQLHVVVDAPQDPQSSGAAKDSSASGARPVRVFSRGEGVVDGPWVLHASGLLDDDRTAEPPFDMAQWPPAGAVAVSTEGAYELLAGRGYDYGQVFRGLRATWRRGEEIFAEVALHEQAWTESRRFALHPALLDAALHAGLLEDAGGGTRLPVAWRDVSLQAAGASALRVRIAPAEADGVMLSAVDETGAPVFTVRAVTSRPVSAEQLGNAPGGYQRSLFGMEWKSLSVSRPSTVLPERHFADALAAVDEVAPDLVFLHCPVTDGDTLAAARTATDQVVDAIRSWLDDVRFVASKLVVVTHGVTGGAVRHAPVWGLVRAAEAENPGRFVLVDVDGAEESRRAVSVAAASGEPELTVHDGVVMVPRLARVSASAGEETSTRWGPEGTVLVTGGTGTLGGLVARHLVAVHGVRHLVLAGRRGADAPGAAELVAELRECGADVRVATCDVADREALRELLDGIPGEHPLRAVVHMAGVSGTGMIGSLTPERTDAVLRPKADGAWHLHELTRDLPLSAFVLFSAAAGMLLPAGQAGHAAASAFLDTLAEHRRSQGLPATSLAFGPWEVHQGLSEGDRQRIGRQGIRVLPTDEALALFDAALATDETLLIPAGLDLAVIRALAAVEEVPALLRGLVRVSGRQAVLAGGASASALLEQRLDGLSATEKERLLLDLVRTHVATVLGHASAEAVEPERAFQEMGFDSLGAVELRNRLRVVTGLQLPTTLVFDYPTSRGVAAYIEESFGPKSVDEARPVLAEVDRLEAALAATSLTGGDHTKIAHRLEAVLRAWHAVGESVGTTAPEQGYEEATDEELFDVLDNELGIS